MSLAVYLPLACLLLYIKRWKIIARTRCRFVPECETWIRACSFRRIRERWLCRVVSPVDEALLCKPERSIEEPSNSLVLQFANTITYTFNYGFFVEIDAIRAFLAFILNVAHAGPKGCRHHLAPRQAFRTRRGFRAPKRVGLQEDPINNRRSKELMTIGFRPCPGVALKADSLNRVSLQTTHSNWGFRRWMPMSPQVQSRMDW